LRKWRVADYKPIFTRALGLQCLFANAPDREVLSDDFVRNSNKYADQMFSVRQGERDSTPFATQDVEFEL